MYPFVVRSLVSLLILVLAVLSVMGMFWWDAPPEPLAHYAGGGKFILGVLVVSSIFGLWKLWSEPLPSAENRNQTRDSQG